MRELIAWLAAVEKTAAEIYETAAVRLKDDPEFTGFVRHLAKDEREHQELMHRALKLYDARPALHDPAAVITIEPESRRGLERLLRIFRSKLDSDNFTGAVMAELIVTTEFSELNEIFLYVCNAMRRESTEFTDIVKRIQQHKNSVIRFIESRPEFSSCLDKARQLPDIHSERILVVDDNTDILDTITIILDSEGMIEKASNGAEALAKISENYYAAIVTDIDMPVMNGIELYMKAVDKYPTLSDRFLFLSGVVDEERQAFFESKRVRYLQKPSGINELRGAVVDILNGTSRHHA